MLDGIVGSFASSAFSNASIDWCAADSFMNTSVLPHQTITRRSRPLSLLELADVGAELLGKILLVLALLHVRAVEPLDVPLIEHRRHRLDGLELGLDLIEQRRLEHAGGARRLVGVLFENVPAAEDDVVEVGERNDLLDLRRAAFGALAETDGAHLRERADRIGQPFSNGQHAGNGGRADGAEADEQNAQFAFCWSDFKVFHSRQLYHRLGAIWD